MRYVLAGSGHIAGVVNPADKPKYQYWTTARAEASSRTGGAGEGKPGSWWTDWIQWVVAQAPAKVAARKPGAGELKPIGDAPGDYVRVTT